MIKTNYLITIFNFNHLLFHHIFSLYKKKIHSFNSIHQMLNLTLIYFIIDIFMTILPFFKVFNLIIVIMNFVDFEHF